MSKRTLFLIGGAIALAAVTAGATLAVASGSRGGHRLGAAQPLIAGQTTGGLCRAGYDTETNEVTVANGFPGTTVATVTVTKPCAGAVIGNFQTETNTSGSGPDIVLDQWLATCVGAGGFTHHCGVGNSVSGSPGGVDLTFNQEPSLETHGAIGVWSGLRAGVWRFDVNVGGDGASTVFYRTFSVQAYTGG